MNSLNTSKQAVTQFSADARVLADFEHSDSDSGKSFNYKESVISSPESSVPEEHITAYLSKMQSGGVIQSFGCLLAVEEHSFRILAYSENTIDLLDLKTLVEYLLGFDVRTLFTKSSTESLMKVISSLDISHSNPVSVVSESAQIPFLAILHRVDIGIVIDLELVSQGDPTFSIEGGQRANKLALEAISRLQSLPHGDIGSLRDVVVEDVRELTGYDRVMVYKFHEDEHGEVVAEIRRSDLEPYLGLHYPAIDVPQVARFLFKKNRVRMISDFHTATVGIIQSEDLKQPLILVSSTLRAPHACHTQYMANMGSHASLVMAIIANENGPTKLWGLAQLFSMVLKDAPFGIVTRSPNVMDYVNCNGAAFYYGGVCRVFGVTPTELQIKDIIDWLLEYNKNLIVWSTDSLVDASYPNAYALGDVVCGMATVRITSKGFLFWFRNQTEQEVRWGGVEYHHNDKVDDNKMQPISSFKAFLEVVKNKSFLWEAWEINAIHSLQHAVQESFFAQENELEMDKLAYVANDMDKLLEMAVTPIFLVDTIGNIVRWNSKIAELTGLHATSAVGKCFVNELVHEESRERFEYYLSHALQDYIDSVVNVCFVGQDITEMKLLTDMFVRQQKEYKTFTENLKPLISPVFASDENARCSKWNASMEKLTGWERSEVIGKLLPVEIFGGCCRLKGQDDVIKLMILLYQTCCRHENGKIPLSFFDKEGIYVETILTIKKRIDVNGQVVGCFGVLQTVPNMEHDLHELSCFSRTNKE
ncbi:hypothetical protein AQUCO_01200213v1 [Aquilegia coerulea]|uniref:PAS domain-containing protein n=1 Tax=Aquilegia coerulea TaxID=218851 RepID=A0A2G5E508_AQUCA|nr:hypothetical protein AQUCO_01200213v1 [Aquilegia coerulea]